MANHDPALERAVIQHMILPEAMRSCRICGTYFLLKKGVGV